MTTLANPTVGMSTGQSNMREGLRVITKKVSIGSEGLGCLGGYKGVGLS